MLTYNTHRGSMPLPQYGRYIQQMVDYCRTIADRDERQHCAQSIVKIISVLFPPDGNEDREAYNRKLWDHLAIMAEFDLDINWPYDVVNENPAATRPARIEYASDEVKRRNYGRIAQQLVQTVADMPEGDEREALTLLVANHIKKLSLASGTGDAAPDDKVLSDLRIMSHGSINLDPETVHLHEFSEAPVATGKKKKKKKK